jgi:hypothetical protein
MPCHPHHGGCRVREARNQHEAGSKPNVPHGIISQKIELFPTTVVRTSNPEILLFF